MSIWKIYKRVLSMLVAERAKTLWVVVSGIALGAVPVAEGVLLKFVVDALTLGQGAFPIIGVWAVVGLIGILAGVVVAVMADRLAHRRRLAALGQAFERAIILPISYHAEKGSGAVVRTILPAPTRCSGTGCPSCASSSWRWSASSCWCRRRST